MDQNLTPQKSHANLRAIKISRGTQYAAWIRENYHKSSDCFEYPKNPYLNQATQKLLAKLFLPKKSRLDFRRLPGPVFDPPRGMSAGSFSRTAAGNRAYKKSRNRKFQTPPKSFDHPYHLKSRVSLTGSSSTV